MVVAEALGLRLDRESYLFSPMPDGSVPYAPDSISHAWARVRQAAAADGVRLHDLRHFAVSYASVAAEILGMDAGGLAAYLADDVSAVLLADQGASSNL